MQGLKIIRLKIEDWKITDREKIGILVGAGKNYLYIW